MTQKKNMHTEDMRKRHYLRLEKETADFSTSGTLPDLCRSLARLTCLSKVQSGKQNSHWLFLLESGKSIPATSFKTKAHLYVYTHTHNAFYPASF